MPAGFPACLAPEGKQSRPPNAASSHMGAKYGAATSLRSCCVVLGDQDGWGTNRLSKAESILGTGMSQNLSRGRRHAWMIYLEDQPDTVHPHGCGEHASGKRFIFSSFRFIPTGVGNTRSHGEASGNIPVHPHGCGEHRHLLPYVLLLLGSSPRVWGTLTLPAMESEAKAGSPQ